MGGGGPPRLVGRLVRRSGYVPGTTGDSTGGITEQELPEATASTRKNKQVISKQGGQSRTSGPLSAASTTPHGFCLWKLTARPAPCIYSGSIRFPGGGRRWEVHRLGWLSTGQGTVVAISELRQRRWTEPSVQEGASCFHFISYRLSVEGL